LYSEQLFRLPHSQWCYRPVYEVPLSTTRDDDAAPVVFGCFNPFAKISDPCLALWCEILKQVPGSQLRVKGVPGQSAENAFRNRVESHGVDPRRIETVGRIAGIHEYFAAIGNVDVALDTFPYSGATTTFDTLWMGVPVIALPGNTAVGRSSFSILSSLAAPELIATSSADLILRNVALATDAGWRRTLRGSLRSRLESSPLMDAPGFTRGLEEGFRTMWHDNRLI
jgi:predicted O-linked N-acetylglucosamine transferase (SPINDLY family)